MPNDTRHATFLCRSDYTLVEDRAELRLRQAFLEDRILHPVRQNSAIGFREDAKRRPHLELEDLEWVQHKLTNRIASTTGEVTANTAAEDLNRLAHVDRLAVIVEERVNRAGG